MRISAIIPTLGRSDELIATVRALAGQSRVPDEIVVVDQNVPSFPAVDEALAKIPNVRHIHSPKPGLAHNSNVALNEASGDVLIYLDDDIVPVPDLVKNHARNYEDPSFIAGGFVGVAGRVVNAHGDPDPDSLREVGVFNRFTGRLVGQFNFKERRESSLAQGANMSFLKSALLDAGGFDLQFDGNAYRVESDVCLSIRERGKKLVFDPSAEVFHLMAQRGGCRVPDKAMHTYHDMKNTWRLYRKHAARISLPFLFVKQITWCVLKALYNRSFRIFSLGMKGLREA